ncbi:hypothetical protein AMS59_13660 [Lysinibacillus sp. FJAT-14745]|uniref:ABC-three component system middle component 6 n=1 Tax=Lysinibacillus sp. FJAT-14745 TaxID=1704289 RepID=UPI0006AB97DD|nr:ABC-three component system middle component 6 [Lysinibacillus sp. FJAT-14745]KOP78142.1 hypothetical protein AMS59_13660 [Lysinibacillus sp. FJAT-14745]
MILPNKYVTTSESYIGISSLILNTLGKRTITIDKLWKDFEKKYIIKANLKNPPTFHKYVLVLNFMFMVGMINYTEKGEIVNENIKINN